MISIEIKLISDMYGDDINITLDFSLLQLLQIWKSLMPVTETTGTQS